MKVFVSLLAVLVLLLLAYASDSVGFLRPVFGIYLPYIAVVVFLAGFIAKVVGWAKIPVPFRIPTTCGQQKSHSWITPNALDNPSTKCGVFGRMVLEVFFFRSLLQNTKTEVRPGGQVVHSSTKWLWVGSMVFHWCFLIVLIRHLRFLLDPVPSGLNTLAGLDTFLQIGVPEIALTGFALLGAAAWLFVRRIASPQLRYASLPADYFPLFLILAIACTGILLRHVVRTDITTVKEHVMALVSFSAIVPEGVGWVFFAHLLCVSVLMMYFPFSKLMHMGGVFMSPTRNMANNNRMVRHVNPWDYPVETHPYDEYEDEFRDKMQAAGIPVEKE